MARTFAIAHRNRYVLALLGILYLAHNGLSLVRRFISLKKLHTDYYLKMLNVRASCEYTEAQAIELKKYVVSFTSR